MLGVCPPLEESAPLAPTVRTPMLAMVTLPTPPLFTLMPAPATLLNTPALLTVGLAAVPPIAMPAFPEVTELTPFTAPVEPLKLSTPMLATVGLLAVPPMLMPALPDATESTPALLRVNAPPSDNGPPPESPAPVVMVTELFCKAELGILLTFAPEIPVSAEPSPENECAATFPATSTLNKSFTAAKSVKCRKLPVGLLSVARLPESRSLLFAA